MREKFRIACLPTYLRSLLVGKEKIFLTTMIMIVPNYQMEEAVFLVD